jgi:hypothetical protein
MEVGLQRVDVFLRQGMEVGGGGACQVVDHCQNYQFREARATPGTPARGRQYNS